MGVNNHIVNSTFMVAYWPAGEENFDVEITQYINKGAIKSTWNVSFHLNEVPGLCCEVQRHPGVSALVR